MIRLTRVRTKGAVPAAFRGPKRVEQALKLLVDAGAKREFDSGYWKKAKKQLKAESGGKCAYCEAPTSVVAHGDVEHFRPKNTYWWLAYCYDNYLFSCQICNQSFKGDAFPLPDEAKRWPEPALPPGADSAARAEWVRRLAPDPLDEADGLKWADFRAARTAEGAHLPDPYEDEVEDLFSWEADAALQEVAVRPRTPAAQPSFDAAVRYFGLNRPELLAERWKTFRSLDVFARAFLSPGLDPALRAEVRDMLVAMMQPDAAFAGMCRYFVRDVWGLPL